MQAFFQSAQHFYEKREGSGIGSGAGSGSVPLTNGSGFWEAQKHADPADPVPDPDLQHCQICISSIHPLAAQLSHFPLIASSCTFNSLLPIHLILLPLETFPNFHTCISSYCSPFSVPISFSVPYPPLVRQFLLFIPSSYSTYGFPEPVLLNVCGAQESIPRNEFRQPM